MRTPSSRSSSFEHTWRAAGLGAALLLAGGLATGCGSEEAEDEAADATDATDDEGLDLSGIGADGENVENGEATRTDGDNGTGNSDDGDDPDDEGAFADPVLDENAPAAGSEFCDALIGQQDLVESDESPLWASDDIAVYFEEVDKLYAEIEPLAPAELADPLGVVRSKTGEVAATVDDGAPEDYDALLALATDEEFISAQEALTDYVIDQCGVEPASTVFGL